MKKQAAYFAIAGSIGFAIDAGGVFLLAQVFDVNPVIARIPALTLAILTTYLINRYLTFNKVERASIVGSLIKYVSTNALTQGLNFLIYTGLVLKVPLMHVYPVIAVAIGSISVMVISFLLSKYWVFK